MAAATLRPVGAWLGASCGRLKERGLTLSGLLLFGLVAAILGAALVYALAFVFVGFLRGWDNLGRIASDPRRLGIFLEESAGAITLFNLLAAFVALRVQCWVFHAAIHASGDERVGFREALRRGKSRGYGFLALFVMQQILVQVGMVLLVLPGIALTVLLGLAPWSFAKDGTGVFESLGASARMAKGRFFGLLGRLLLAVLIAVPVMVVPVLGWLLGPAWVLVAWSLLHEDLRAPVPARTAPAAARPIRPRRVPA
jgi:hypothetical protein